MLLLDEEVFSHRRRYKSLRHCYWDWLSYFCLFLLDEDSSMCYQDEYNFRTINEGQLMKPTYFYMWLCIDMVIWLSLCYVSIFFEEQELICSCFHSRAYCMRFSLVCGLHQPMLQVHLLCFQQFPPQNQLQNFFRTSHHWLM